jgi:hypothetical protein
VSGAVSLRPWGQATMPSQQQRRQVQRCRKFQKELREWRRLDDEAGRVLASGVQMLSVLQLITTGDPSSLGALQNLGDTPELLINAHIKEFDRLLRLARSMLRYMLDSADDLDVLADEAARESRCSDGDQDELAVASCYLCDVSTSMGCEMWRKRQLIEHFRCDTEEKSLQISSQIAAVWSSTTSSSFVRINEVEERVAELASGVFDP